MDENPHADHRVVVDRPARVPDLEDLGFGRDACLAEGGSEAATDARHEAGAGRKAQARQDGEGPGREGQDAREWHISTSSLRGSSTSWAGRSALPTSGGSRGSRPAAP